MLRWLPVTDFVDIRRFVFDFPDFMIVKNDKIMGTESGLMREIDVSIRGEVAGTDIRYITQANSFAEA